MINRMILVTALCGLLLGCATHPGRIDAGQVDAVQYIDHKCEDLFREMQDRVDRGRAMYDDLHDEFLLDSLQALGAVAGAWPLVFFLDGGSKEAREYSTLKGEYETMRKIALKRKCDYYSMPKPNWGGHEEEEQ